MFNGTFLVSRVRTLRLGLEAGWRYWKVAGLAPSPGLPCTSCEAGPALGGIHLGEHGRIP